MKFLHYKLIVLLFVSLAACGKKDGESNKNQNDSTEIKNHGSIELTAQQVKISGIEPGSVEMRQLSGTIKANGILDVPPQNLVTVSAPVAGFLLKTDLLQGMRVKKGQLIATLQNPDYIQMQQDYLDNKSQLEYQQAEYERQQQLAKENINAQKTLQQAKAQYMSTLAKVNGLKARLQLIGINPTTVEKGNLQSTISIMSPISGYVTQINVNMGVFLNQADMLFKIVDTEHLHAELKIFERDLPKIKIGNTVHFTLANETQDRTAKVYLIGREIGPDRMVRIHCHLNTEDPELLPGMYLEAQVETHAGNVPALPETAVVNHDGKKYIFIYKGDKNENGDTLSEYEMKEIGTGVSEFGYTEIIFPEKTDIKSLKVVVKGAYALLSKKYNSEGEDEHGH